MKIFLPGGAGLVGINLIASITSSNPDWKMVVVDKNLNSINVRHFEEGIYLLKISSGNYKQSKLFIKK